MPARPLPEIGNAAPDSRAPATDGDFALSALRGQWVILYFYPKDNTAGCTVEAREFADLHAAFKRAGAVVVGVSRDSLHSHAGFRARQRLPFTLVADTDESACHAWDVIRAKTMYGKPVRGIERSTFLIDPQGILRAAWRKVKAAGHAAEVLATLKTLKQTLSRGTPPP